MNKKMRLRNRGLLLAGIIVVLAVLSACGTRNYEPVAIEEGIDRCTVCNMLIKDDANATEIVLKNGKVLKFDDLGDMYQWTKKNGLKDVGARFVRDIHTKEWIKLQEAAFVHDPENETPMGFGVYAFKTKEAAERFIAEQGRGKLLAAQELDNFSWEKGGTGMKGSGEMVR